MLDHMLGFAHLCYLSARKDHTALAKAGARSHLVAYEQYRSPAFADAFHLIEAFDLELRIDNRKHFVNDKYLRLEKSGYRKCQSQLHAAAVMLQRCIDELFHACKINDLVKLQSYRSLFHPQQRAVEENILSSCQLGVKSCSYLEQASYP